MTYHDFDTVQHAARAAMAGSPEVEEARYRFKVLLTAFLPAAAILAVSATILVRLLST